MRTTFARLLICIIGFVTAAAANSGEQSKFLSPDVLAVVRVDKVTKTPPQVDLSTIRVLKGQLAPSLRFSYEEWGEEVLPVGTHVLLRLKRENARLTVMDRNSNFVPATREGRASNDADTVEQKVAGELVAALFPGDDASQASDAIEWRTRRLISDLVSLGEVGAVELRRLHASASAEHRLLFLGGLLELGDSTALESDFPLLINPPPLMTDGQEEAVANRLSSRHSGISAHQAVRLLASSSAKFREAGADALRGMANAKALPLEPEILNTLAKRGLADSSLEVRYYTVYSLSEITRLHDTPSRDLFVSKEKQYLSFWKGWVDGDGVNKFLKAAAAPAGEGEIGRPSKRQSGTVN